MKRLSNMCYTTESYLLPMVEEEFGEITSKMKEVLRILEVIPRPGFLSMLYVGADWGVRCKIGKRFFVRSW